MAEDETIRTGVGAVVFRGEEVLLIRRGRPPFQGEWSIPGGKVEHGERLEAALVREVAEETGVEIAVGALIGVFESLPDENGTGAHYIMIDYAAEWVAGEPVAGDDAAAAEFAPLDDARERLAWDETRRALAMALAGRRAQRRR